MSHRNASCQTIPFPTVTLDQALSRGQHSEPDTSVLVSATAFTTRGTFGANGIHFRLDFVHGHRFIGVGAHLVHHFAVILQRLAVVLIKVSNFCGSSKPFALAPPPASPVGS